MSTSSSTFDRLAKRLGTDSYSVERWVLIIMQIIIIFSPQLFRMGLPAQVQPWTRGIFDTINSLPSGSTALFVFDSSPESFMSFEGYSTTAVINHLYSKGITIVFMSFTDAGPLVFPLFFTSVPNLILPKYDKEGYGIKWVYIGLLPGGGSTTTLQSFAVNGLSMITVDNWGNDITKMTIYQKGLNSINSFDLIVTTQQNVNVMNFWIIPYNRKYVVAGQGEIRWFPHVVNGYLAGMRGTGEYEGLTKVSPGPAAFSLDVISIGTLYVAGLIIWGNISSYMKRRRMA